MTMTEEQQALLAKIKAAENHNCKETAKIDWFYTASTIFGEVGPFASRQEAWEDALQCVERFDPDDDHLTIYSRACLSLEYYGNDYPRDGEAPVPQPVASFGVSGIYSRDNHCDRPGMITVDLFEDERFYVRDNDGKALEFDPAGYLQVGEWRFSAYVNEINRLFKIVREKQQTLAEAYIAKQNP